MTLTSFPTHPTGSGRVRAKILRSTFCQPHGHVSQGEVVNVSVDEFHLLKSAGAAELAPPEPPKAVDPPALTEDHLKFVQSRGCKIENLEGLAAFLGKMTTEERDGFLSDFEESKSNGQGEKITVDQAKAELGAKKVEELREIAKREGLDPNGLKKDELIAALIEAAMKSS